MALRLAGEPFLAIQGADSQGWVREITAQDALPGLKINQQGTGRVFDFQDGGVSKMYLPDGGNVTIAGSLVFDLANDVTITTTNPAAPRTLTIPAVGGNRTFAFLEEEQTFTAAHIFTTVQATDTTDATSPTAGAVKTAGGLAVAKAMYVGGLVGQGTGNTQTTRTNSNTQNVAQSATPITTVGGNYQFVVVVGRLSSTGATAFIDLVLCGYSATPTVVASHAPMGSPGARTYSMVGGILNLLLASGTYDITTKVLNFADPN